MHKITYTFIAVLLIVANCAFTNTSNFQEDTIARSVEAAETHWDKRSVYGCDHSDLNIGIESLVGRASKGQSADGLWTGGCNILLSKSMMVSLRAEENDDVPYILTWVQRYVCAVITHEIGHSRGQMHTLNGVMRPVNPETPWRCRIAFPLPKRL